MKDLVLQDSIKDFEEVAERQELKGIKKYGEELNALNFEHDWIQMCKEEQVDGYQYLVAEQKKREFITNKIRSIMGDGQCNERCENMRSEINFWLDKMDGKD